MAAPEADSFVAPAVTGRARPLHALGPVAGCVFTVLAWAAIAHNSGSGWVQALGVMLGSVLLVGLVGPGRLVTRVQVSVKSAPVDATVGESVGIVISASARVRVRPVSPEGSAGFFGPRGVIKETDAETQDLDRVGALDMSGDESPRLRIVPKRRGILSAVTVDIASAAPFGLLWWTRRATLLLPVEMAVAPRPTKAFTIPPEGDDAGDEASNGRSSAVGETRGVREYEHGDARRTVHWRASAHAGRLMVREMEMPAAEPVIVRIELPVDQAEADEIASRALATVIALLDRSRPVMLATHEPTGDRLAQVTTPKDAGRRLARAVAGGERPGSVTIEEPGIERGTGQAQQSRQREAFQSTRGNPR